MTSIKLLLMNNSRVLIKAIRNKLHIPMLLIKIILLETMSFIWDNGL